MLDEAMIGIAQWLPMPGRADRNLDTALKYIGRLGSQGCDLIVLPEMWPSGYDWDTLIEDVRAAAQPLDGPLTGTLAEAASAAGAWLAAGSVPERDGDRIYNTALLFDRAGALRATHRKAHLYTPAAEHEAFGAGDCLTVCPTDDFGDVGLTVCFDGDFPEVARTLRDRGARVVIQVSAYEAAAADWWNLLYPAHALANGQWWIMSNQCGTNPSGTLLGASRIISPFGETIARAAGAADGETPEPELLVATIKLREEIERADREIGVLWDMRRHEMYASEELVSSH